MGPTVATFAGRVTWTALAAARLAFRAEEVAARSALPQRIEAVHLRSPSGHNLPARLHIPVDRTAAERHPAVLICPGGLDGIKGAEGLSVVLGAQRLARAGFAALAWSPSGRDGAPGMEDRNGPRHQAEAAEALRTIVRHPSVDPERVVVLTISFGIMLGLAAILDSTVGVRGLVDWEGPPSRKWFVASRLRLSSRPEDEAFWADREAVTRVGRLRVPYWRAQGSWDHVHGPHSELALEMVNAAVAGGVPDVRLNGKRSWSPPKLLSSWPMEHSLVMTRWVEELCRGAPPEPQRNSPAEPLLR